MAMAGMNKTWNKDPAGHTYHEFCLKQAGLFGTPSRRRTMRLSNSASVLLASLQLRAALHTRLAAYAGGTSLPSRVFIMPASSSNAAYRASDR